MNTDRLKALIQSSGLSKSQLAAKCGVSRTTLDHILAGEDAKMSTAQALAGALGVRVGYLFDEGDDQTDALLAEVQELRMQLARQQEARAARITVEVELTPEELDAAGLTKRLIEKVRRKT